MHLGAPSASRQRTTSRFGSSSGGGLGHVFSAVSKQPSRNNSFGTMRTVSMGGSSTGSNESSDDSSDIYDPPQPRRSSSSNRYNNNNKRRSFFSSARSSSNIGDTPYEVDENKDHDVSSMYQLNRSMSMPAQQPGAYDMKRTSSFDAIGQMISSGLGSLMAPTSSTSGGSGGTRRKSTFEEAAASRARAQKMAHDFELNEDRPVELNRTASFPQQRMFGQVPLGVPLERKSTFDERQHRGASRFSHDFGPRNNNKPAIEVNRTSSFRRRGQQQQEDYEFHQQMMMEEEEEPIMEWNGTPSFQNNNNNNKRPTMFGQVPIRAHPTLAESKAAATRARAAELSDRFELSEHKPMELNRTASFDSRRSYYTGPVSFSGGTPKQAAEKFRNKFSSSSSSTTQRHHQQPDPLQLNHEREQERLRKEGMGRRKAKLRREKSNGPTVLSTRTPLRQTQSYPAPAAGGATATTITTYRVGAGKTTRRKEELLEEGIEVELAPTLGVTLNASGMSIGSQLSPKPARTKPHYSRRRSSQEATSFVYTAAAGVC
uniref:Uncharacterized protein n=1 Tax=Grammatophora oceanica TaxID=210454 RepID=A0A7S1VFB9_9STRA|mmetsp:Transcript_45114/g.66995  ORF Transcript_45114/g.66995 Transcript_45114/m.66995 type:complete len:543 (+) Transcript_45114:87-1715(+)